MKPLSITIIEEALGRQSGHWRHYIGDLAAGLRAGGDSVRVLCHREAPVELLEAVGGTPWMRRSIWAGHQGKLADFKHIVSYTRDVSRALREVPASDVVLCLTMRWQHAVAWNYLARRWGQDHFRKAVLLFVLGPGRYAGPGLPSTIARSLRNRIWRGAMRSLRTQQAVGRIVLAAETARMRAELERFCGLPITQFCHPVVFDGQAARSTPSRRPLAICAPGFARYEKGSDLLQEAMLLLERRQPKPDFQLVLQWLQPFRMPDGSEVGLKPELAKLPQVRVLDREIGQREYTALLAESDLVVLPYRPASYQARVSRVAIEAAILGLPMIYTPDTWLAEVCAEYGAGVPIQSLTAEGVAEAITEAVSNHANLASQAAARREAARSYYSVASFRNTFCTALPA
jgi:glycosyltransferase involved in cell wall biosynthesis